MRLVARSQSINRRQRARSGVHGRLLPGCDAWRKPMNPFYEHQHLGVSPRASSEAAPQSAEEVRRGERRSFAGSYGGLRPRLRHWPSAVPGANKDVGRRQQTWWSRRSTIIGLPGKEVPMTPNIHTIIRQHVSLEVRCIDRVYLHAYMPKLQTSGGLCYFLADYVARPVPAPALLKPRHNRFVAAVETFARDRHIPFVSFEHVDSKDAFVAPYRARFTPREGVVLVGAAQEKQREFQAHKHSRRGDT